MSQSSRGRRRLSSSHDRHEYDKKRYFSSQSIAGSSSSKGSAAHSKKEPADYEDYLSSGKTQESFLEALKEPALPGKKKVEEEIIIFLLGGIAFYYQNKAEKHTWFIRLEPSLLAQDLPYWFYNWFAFIGPEEYILPCDIFEKYELYLSSNPKIRG